MPTGSTVLPSPLEALLSPSDSIIGHFYCILGQSKLGGTSDGEDGDGDRAAAGSGGGGGGDGGRRVERKEDSRQLHERYRRMVSGRAPHIIAKL